MNQQAPASVPFSPFWPLTLSTLALAVFLAWQVTLATRQHVNLLRLASQQEQWALQAAQTESRFQQLTMDLLTLAKTDEDAKSIVGKYRITYKSPEAAPALPGNQ